MVKTQRDYAADIATVKMMRAHEKLLFPLIKETFSGIKKEIQKNIRRRYAKSEQPIFNVEFWIDFMAALAKKPLQQITTEAIRDALRDMNITGDLTEYEKEIAHAVKNSTGKMTEGFDDMEKEVRARIRREIAEHPLLRGDDLLRRLDAISNGILGDYKVRRIAQTTSTYANGQITGAAHDRNGFVSVWRHTGRAKNDRKTHIAADGQKRAENGFFSVGGESVEHPADGSAANAINCHCVLRARRE